MRQCEKCAKEGHYPEIAPLVMVGGYHTELCLPCSNVFHEYMYPQMLEFAKIESRLNAAIAVGMLGTAAELAEQKHAERIRLYAISKEWVASK